MPYQVLDHTADLMVEVWAGELSGLFSEAARAMFDILTEAAVQPERSIAVSVEADGLDGLLVSWLTELLFLHETELWLFSRFEIGTLTDTALEAEVWGEKLDRERHPIERELKAVTYHRLRIAERNGRFETKIVFDV